ncbi:MAG TPA: DUF5677 domain-containing protein [Ignavibacteria bacterium]
MTEEQYLLLEGQIIALDILYKDSSLFSEQLQSQFGKTSFDEFILLILFKRVIKFLRAYIILIKNGLSEPSMSIVRSIFETDLLIRWCIKDKDNVKKYFKEGKSSAIIMLDNLTKNKYFSTEKQKTIEEALNKYNKEKINFTKWKDIAKDTGMLEIFNFVYPVLSAMSHGSLMSISGQVEEKEISIDSDFVNISASLPLANNFVVDCYTLCGEWMYNKNIRPVPNLLTLLLKLDEIKCDE